MVIEIGPNLTSVLLSFFALASAALAVIRAEHALTMHRETEKKVRRNAERIVQIQDYMDGQGRQND